MALEGKENSKNVDVAGAPSSDSSQEYESDSQDSGNTDDLVERKARESGWVPFDEWDGDPAEWTDAANYNFRGQLMRRIQSQSRQLIDRDKKIQQMDAAIKALGETNSKIADVQYEKAMKDLKAQRREALQSGDDESLDAIEENIDSLKEAKEVLQKGKEPQRRDPQTDEVPEEFQHAFQEFLRENEWYKTNPAMRGAADALGNEFFAQGMQAQDVFDNIVTEMKKEFPTKFGKPNPKSSPVDDPSETSPRGRTSSGRGKSKYTKKDLTEGEMAIAKTVVESGAFKNIQEYVDAYAEGGGFEGERL